MFKVTRAYVVGWVHHYIYFDYVYSAKRPRLYVVNAARRERARRLYVACYRAPNAAHRERARRLYVACYRAPNAVRVESASSTIHSKCWARRWEGGGLVTANGASNDGWKWQSNRREWRDWTDLVETRSTSLFHPACLDMYVAKRDVKW